MKIYETQIYRKAKEDEIVRPGGLRKIRFPFKIEYPTVSVHQQKKEKIKGYNC